MQEILTDIESKGATLVAITPQLPENSARMIEKRNLEFDMLQDNGNEYAAQLGLRFELPDDLKALFGNFPLDLAVTNGEPSWTLPVPARILIGADGIVRSIDADPDYTRRPEPEKTLSDLAAMG